MSSTSTSLKELSKAISVFLEDPVTPLPDSLIETIASYLRRHQKYDNAAADRLQEELFVIFDRHVKERPSAAGSWLAVVRRLLPVLQTPERILQWFDKAKVLLDNVTFEKGVVEELIAALMDMIGQADEYQETADDDADKNSIIDRLFFMWIDKFYPLTQAGVVGMENNERMVRESLNTFGKKRPKQFFSSLNSYLVEKLHRKTALRFFCDFVQTQPPRLHEIQQTSLFSNLLICLQYDTSTTIVSTALTALVMLLPHMPGSLVPYLPTLFNIYARMLFWEKERAGSVETPIATDQKIKWEVASFAPGVEDSAIPQLPNYFTILYGLYPINFMDYIRKPQRYLRHANVSESDNFQIQSTEIRHESEKFRARHALHPNFFTLTIESEKTDVSRWIKSEAPEVVAECMDLCLPSNDLGPPLSPTSQATVHEGDSIGGFQPLVPYDSWSGSGLMRTDSLVSSQSPPCDGSRDEATSISMSDRDKERSSLASRNKRSTSQTQLRDLFQTHRMKASLTQSLANDSVPSLASSHPDSEKLGSASHGAGINQQIPHLQRQILLLQNDLSFERYLKQQHMAHIGDLRRKLVTEAATEAETQNLILLNRSLRARFEEAKKAEMQVRKESEKSRAIAKKWEAELSNKLKALREEAKKMHVGKAAIEEKLEESVEERERLKKIICDKEVKELTWKQDIQSVELQSAEFNRLRDEVERLTILERDHQAEEFERAKILNAAVEADDQVEVLKMQLAAQKNEVQKVKRFYETQIVDLRRILSSHQEENQRVAARASVAVEESLAASRAKQAEMLKQLKLLNRKYTMLQSSFLDLQSEEPKRKPRLAPLSTAVNAREQAPLASNPVTAPSRFGKGFSDPQYSNGIAHALTSPIKQTRSMSTDSGAPGTDTHLGPHSGHSLIAASSPSHMVTSPDWPFGASDPFEPKSPQKNMLSPTESISNSGGNDSKGKSSKSDGSNASSRIPSSSGGKREKKSGFRTIRSLY